MSFPSAARILLNGKFGRDAVVDGEPLRVIETERQQGHDAGDLAERNRLVETLNLSWHPEDLPRPKVGRVMVVDGVSWTVGDSKTTKMFHKIGFWRELS